MHFFFVAYMKGTCILFFFFPLGFCFFEKKQKTQRVILTDEVVGEVAAPPSL
jgi:hypothetical protein